MGSSYFCPSPIFFADKFVVSVSTEISGSFNTMKVFFFFGVEKVEVGDGKKLPWERARPQFPDILGIVRETISPGPSQGPVGKLRHRQDN